MKMAFDRLLGRVRLNLPVFHRREQRFEQVDQALQIRSARLPADMDQFAGLQAAQLFADALLDAFGRFAVDLGGGKLAGGDVAVGDAGRRAPAVDGDGHQVVVAFVVQQAGLDHGAAGDNARHLALHQPIARLADLLGDGDLVAALDQLGHIAVHRMVGNAGQRHPLVVAHRAAGKHHIADARHDLGVVVKGLVEVTQPEEEDAVCMLALQRQVLASHGCCHRRSAFV